MSKRTSPLDSVTVAAPCEASWESMIGDERVRFCGLCNLNVYNLSAMNRQDAERLISEAEGRLCIRYYRRTDGTILTRNCPVGLRALKRRLSRIACAFASAVISFCAGLLAVAGWRERPQAFVAAPRVTIKVDGDLPQTRPMMGTYPAPTVIKGEMVMGDYAIADQGQAILKPKRRWQSAKSGRNLR
jgi:hypothetical protein